MGLKLVQTASQGLSGADANARGWHRNGGTQATDASDDFWPEVSSRYALKNPAAMKPENAQGRVLFEIFVILAIAASLVVAAALFFPGSPQ